MSYMEIRMGLLFLLIEIIQQYGFKTLFFVLHSCIQAKQNVNMSTQSSLWSKGSHYFPEVILCILVFQVQGFICESGSKFWLLRSSQGVLGNAVHGGSALLEPLPCIYMRAWISKSKGCVIPVYVVRLNRLTWTGNFWLMPWNSTFCSKNTCMFSITVCPMFY